MGKRFNNKNNTKSAAFLRDGGQIQEYNIDDLPPAFSFEKMQDGSGNSFNCCEDDDRLYLAKRLYMLSREPWKKIRAASRSGMGAEQIAKNSLKKPVPASVTPDVEIFYSLHYVAKKRFIGYRVGQVFHVLWIDHTFEVYNHG